MHMPPALTPCHKTSFGRPSEPATPTAWVAHVTLLDGRSVRIEVADAPDRMAAVRAALRAVPHSRCASVRLADNAHTALLDVLAQRASSFPLINARRAP